MGNNLISHFVLYALGSVFSYDQVFFPYSLYNDNEFTSSHVISILSLVEPLNGGQGLDSLRIPGFYYYAFSNLCLGRERSGFFGLLAFALSGFSRPPRSGWDCEGFAMSLCSAAVVWGFRCGLAFCQARGVWAFPGFALALAVSATRRSA